MSVVAVKAPKEHKQAEKMKVPKCLVESVYYPAKAITWVYVATDLPRQSQSDIRQNEGIFIFLLSDKTL